MGIGSQDARCGSIMDARTLTATAVAAVEYGSEEVEFGNVGDHVLVEELLRACGRAPSPEGFSAWLDEPSYEPADRLLIRRQGRILAHAQLLFRLTSFGGVKVPSAGLIDLATLPEYETEGLEQRILAAAEQTMRDEGAVVSLLRTDRPEIFVPAGWHVVSAEGYSQANSRDILSYLTAQSSIRRRERRQFHVRLWRHFELDALMPVYRSSADHWGTVVRSEAYWHWLIGRTAHDKVIVAIDGPTPEQRMGEFVEHTNGAMQETPVVNAMPRIAAYAVLQGSRVLELCCQPGCEIAGTLVLARACRDAIEQDHHAITLHTPAHDTLHEVLITAGGTWCAGCTSGDGVLMVRLLDPGRWIEALYPVLLARAKQAGIKRPCDIHLEVGGQDCCLRLTRRSSRLECGSRDHADAACDPSAFERMLLGDVTVNSLLDAGRLSVNRPEVAGQLSALFPAQCLWQSPFDLLRR
jgi:predicted acetyltransferase